MTAAERVARMAQIHPLTCDDCRRGLACGAGFQLGVVLARIGGRRG